MFMLSFRLHLRSGQWLWKFLVRIDQYGACVRGPCGRSPSLWIEYVTSQAHANCPPFIQQPCTLNPTAFGAAASSAAPTFGFGTATATTAPTFQAFPGQQPTSTASGGFGSFGAAAGGFGQPAASSAPLLGGFGATTTTSMAGAPGFGGFASSFAKPAGMGFGSTFGQPQQQQQQQSFQLQPQQQQQQTAEEAFAQSILNVSIFGDERDAVIAKWNYLQALWGSGKSFYNAQAPPLDITPENVLCRFKAMGYSKLPGHDNKLGYVGLTINKPADQVRAQEAAMLDQLRQVFGSRPTIAVRVHSVRALSDARSQATIYVEEKTGAGNETKRISATEVAAYLQQPMPRQQVTSMGVEQVQASVLPDEDQLKEYLETAPKGINVGMWRQAIHDNPDAARLIPVPIIAFNELKWRIRCQEAETDTHTQYLQKVQRDVAELRQRHSSTVAKIMEHRRKFGDLAHRVLQIIVKQECSRKLGVTLTPEEEMLRSKFENMQALVSAPTQFKVGPIFRLVLCIIEREL